jgi:opacity protein-like surface antigen
MVKFRFYAGVLVLSAAATLGVPAASAQTATWNPNDQVELATGFYVRGDASLSREKAPRVASDGGLVFGSQKLNSWALSVGAGNKFNNWFRADMTFELRGGSRASSSSDPFKCMKSVNGLSAVLASGQEVPIGWDPVWDMCREVQSASLQRMSGMVNLYADLGTWSGITPYVGMGVGMTSMKTSGAYDWNLTSDGSSYKPTLVQPDTFPHQWYDDGVLMTPPPADFSWGKQDRSRTINKRTYNPTWALMLGVAVDVTSAAKLDIGYRFINFGSVKASASSTGGASTAHELRMGIRYMIDAP